MQTSNSTSPSADFSSEVGNKASADADVQECTGSAEQALDGIHVSDGINDKEGSIDDKFDTKP